MSLTVPAFASRRAMAESPLAAFVGARAAGLAGDEQRSTALYAALAEADPDNRLVVNRAIAQAIAAGDLKLAVKLSRRVRTSDDLGVDARLLLVADALRRNQVDRALALFERPASEPDLGFLAPFLRAWHAAATRRGDPLALLSAVPGGSPVANYVPEHRTMLLLRMGRIDEARPLAERAIVSAGGRENHLRIALATAFAGAGDKAGASTMLDGRDVALAVARRNLAAGRDPGQAVDTPASAFAEVLLALAIDLNQQDSRSLPIALARVASHAAPKSAEAAMITGILLDTSGKTDSALASYRTVGKDDPFASQARDASVRALLRVDRRAEALALAERATVDPAATADDWSRLGDVLSEADRQVDAAAAYARAAALVEAGGPGGELWTLRLLEGGALEQADRWPEARRALEAARALAPKQPLVLNYLGYAKLERSEDLDAAEAMIREASTLAPDEASITDSLGWAEFKRGRVAQAITTLQRAALADPRQAEIHEHLGDALYTAGRRFEARFAWEAALITAEEDTLARLRAKLAAGLTLATAAP